MSISKELKTKVFLDSGDPTKTREIIDTLGFLDGQTTNPSLFAKSPKIQQQIKSGKKFTKEEVYDAYKKIVQDIRTELPEGSISIEVYADTDTTAEEMIDWGRKMNTWIAGAHIKLPTITNGLAAAETLTMEGINVNMTLVFSEEQAAAVYAATKHRETGTSVILSPFIGRLDDIGQNGVALVKNILQTYNEKADLHIDVLAASIRSAEHLKAVINLGVDIVTVPYDILVKSGDEQNENEQRDVAYDSGQLENMPYQDINLNGHWRDYAIQHDLTNEGLKKFAADWDALLKK